VTEMLICRHIVYCQLTPVMSDVSAVPEKLLKMIAKLPARKRAAAAR